MPQTAIIILAGGRSGWAMQRLGGSPWRALVQVEGEPLIRRVAQACLEVDQAGPVVVAGPEATRPHLPPGVLWAPAGRTAVDTALSGAQAVADSRRLLLCGADAAAVTAPALSDFLRRCPGSARLAMPLVRREQFPRRFPGNLGIYVRLTEGRFTAGSQILIDAALLRERRELLARFVRLRKSQLAMASALGPQFAFDLIRGRLGVAEIEHRAGEIAGVECRAVLDCDPDLAFDMDLFSDLLYLRRRLALGDGAERN